jgi:hypothetical protein
MHAVSQLRKDGMHVLEYGSKQNLLPARQQHRQLQECKGRPASGNDVRGW